MKTFPVFVLSLLFTVSCTVLPDSKKLYLEEVETKIFKLDLESSKNLQYSQFFRSSVDSTDYLTFLNKGNNSIYFYNWENQSFVKKIEYDVSGPNGVGNLSGYYLKSDNEIYVVGSHTYKMQLTDSTANVLHTYSLFQEGMYEALTTLTTNHRPIIELSKDIIYIPCIFLNTNAPVSNQTYNGLFVNLKTGIVETKLTNYPNLYLGETWEIYNLMSFHDYNPDESELLISYPLSDSIFRISTVSEKQLSVLASSKNINIDLDSDQYNYQNSKNSIQAYQNQISSPRFLSLKYNPYQKRYLRLYGNPEEGQTLDGHPVKYLHYYGILFDTDFKRLGEIDLKGRLIGDNTPIFFTEKGFYTQGYDPDENALKIVGYRIVLED